MPSFLPLPPLRLPERFAESWINASVHVVMGAPLREFCLWHRTLFETFGLPWGRPPGPGGAAAAPNVLDLVTAVQICRTRYGQQPDFSPLVLWASKPSWWTHWRLRRRLPRGLAGELMAFVRYLQDFSAPPQLWETQNRGSRGGSKGADGRPPGTLAVATRLIGHGFSETRAWEMPEGMAHWYAATALWLAGQEIPFVTESNATFDFITKLRANARQHKPAKKK